MNCQKINEDTIEKAYKNGYFLMSDLETKSILWLRPNPRAVIPLETFHISKSLAKILKKNIFKITYNDSFDTIVKACARRKHSWISKELIKIYQSLYQKNHALSVECWYQNQLVGGVFGLYFGKAFFAKSMYFSYSNASKVALYYLINYLKKHKFSLLECQYLTGHLVRMGAVEISDKSYMEKLNHALKSI